MGHKYKKYKKYGKNNSGLVALLVLLAIGFVMSFWYILLPTGLLIGYFYKREAIQRFLNRDSIKRLQVLALSIRSGYEKHQELLVEKGEDKVVLQLRNRLLGQLFELDQLYQKFGKYLNGYESKEVVDTLQLKYHLKLPEAKTEKNTDTQVSTGGNAVMDEQGMIADLAPEILETYCNIQRDNLVILEKLEKATDKREELTAIYEANMNRFNDILQGYLKIKKSPKDYFNAEERLVQAKSAMEMFDKDLDDTIKQFNEADMKDFEVSLRMMKREEE
ncbi:hypothetical protein [Streptococcus suis]|uniref:hypothetical protein n=1 Tax=Streptococcus suis TaxID=1307 RepID=UPI0005D15487|nr:hypothetical protein [Streptococcus suis]CYY39631.1 membrane protein [Streptococcus suis]